MQRFLILIILFIISFPSHSYCIYTGNTLYCYDNGLDNLCQYLTINLYNQTKHYCRINARYKHGDLDSAVQPLYVQSNQSVQFSVAQSFFYGPDIEIELHCPNESKKIKLRSQQNFCFLKSGKISTQSSGGLGLQASSYALEGSYGGSRAGEVFWHVRED